MGMAQSRWLARGMIAALLAIFGLAGGSASAAEPVVKVLQVDGIISPATSDFITRGLEQAADEGAALAVIELDTPGGLDTSMRSIVRQILASPIPVVGFVSPGGARAARAILPP
jgi:membrane-bound serine protease (ClpP class)